MAAARDTWARGHRAKRDEEQPRTAADGNTERTIMAADGNYERLNLAATRTKMIEMRRTIEILSMLAMLLWAGRGQCVQAQTVVVHSNLVMWAAKCANVGMDLAVNDY